MHFPSACQNQCPSLCDRPVKMMCGRSSFSQCKQYRPGVNKKCTAVGMHSAIACHASQTKDNALRLKSSRMQLHIGSRH